jgi:osmotically-inducible protein OsmY
MFKSNDFFQSKKHDYFLEKTLRDRLSWDKRVSTHDVKVQVVSGHVILSGKVDSEAKKDAALEDAKTTEGVWDVDDRIEIEPSLKRSDEELRQIMCSQVSQIWLKPDEKIVVSVYNGIVYLEGLAFRKSVKAIADSLAWELSGVNDVFNLIQLKMGEERDPPEEALTDDEFLNQMKLTLPPSI